MMSYFYELVNGMDGRTNLLEIVRAVEAECLSSDYETYSYAEVLEFVALLRKDGVINY
jgi:hypothetical protein